MARPRSGALLSRLTTVTAPGVDATTGPLSGLRVVDLTQALAGPFLALTCEETYVYDHIADWKDGKAIREREKRKRPCATGLFSLVFGALATTMIATRKLNWMALSTRLGTAAVAS